MLNLRSFRHVLPIAVMAAASLAALGTVPSAAAATATHPAQLYVSPQGSDHNPGTRAAPFATLQRAQQEVRALTGTMHHDIDVNLLSGTYRLAQPLTFSAADSGTGGHDVIWQAAPGAHPVISGARRVTGWSQYTTNVWRARVGDARSRQLIVNGVRGLLAQRPITAADYVPDTNGFQTTATDFAGVSHPADVVLAMNTRWKSQRCPVTSVSPAEVNGKTATQVNLNPRCWHYAQIQGLTFTVPTWLEGVPEFINQPGEFAIQSGWLYYMPRPGQDMRSADAELPVLQTLLDGTGTVQAPWHDVTFQGLTFTGTTWLQPSLTGFNQMQADAEIAGNFDVPDQNGQFTDYYVHQQTGAELIPAAVSIGYADRIVFDHDRFTNLGSTALAFGVGAGDSSVVNSQVSDIAASGIRVGDITQNAHHPPVPAMLTHDNTVRDNVITRAGQDYQGAVGIMVGYTTHTVIDHNTVSELPYTGISVGWGWGVPDEAVMGINLPKSTCYQYVPSYSTPTISKNNQVTSNRIVDVMLAMRDGGGIYMLGSQPGTVVKGNYIKNSLGGQLTTSGAGSARGLYLDEGSAGELWTENVIDTTLQWLGMNQHWQTDPKDVVTGNYSNVTAVGLGINAWPNDAYDNTFVTGNQWPPAAQKIIRNAGARPNS